MPMVEYFDRASGSRKRKEFAYGAVGKEKARKFSEEQAKIAQATGARKPKVSYGTSHATGTAKRMEGEQGTAKKTNKGMGTPETKEQREKRHQDYDQKELDKNKPSEAKTEKKEAKYVKLDDKSGIGHKKAIGGGGPDHRNITY